MKKQKITFGKSTTTHYCGDATTEIDVYLDGVRCGQIVGERSDVSAHYWKKEVRTTSYGVSLYVREGEKKFPARDAEFDVDLDANDGKGNARAMLAAAKQFCRENAGKPREVGDDEFVEAMQKAAKILRAICSPGAQHANEYVAGWARCALSNVRDGIGRVKAEQAHAAKGGAA